MLTQGLLTRGGAAQFDLIFLDPPYHQAWLPKLLPLCRQLLKPGGVVYVEAEKSLVEKSAAPAAETGETRSKAETSGATDKMLQPVADDWLTDWNVVRADRAGMVFYHLLQCGNAHRFEA